LDGERDWCSKKEMAYSSLDNDMTTSEDPTRWDTKTQAELQEPRKAALAECCELHQPKPPNQNGNVACNQASSDIL